jgi:polygalacturonase
MSTDRRDFLKLATATLAGATTPATNNATQASSPSPNPQCLAVHNVRAYGATGDGHTIDSRAINAAIDAASAAGGGTIHFPAGTYASYSIRLKSNISLHLDNGATLLAASIPLEGTTNGYDPAEPQGPWEPYQDYGHNHWHNSLIWGENLHDIAIVGPGLIWGQGLSRGHQNDTDLPATTAPGAGNKAIALKNCRNVLLRDFSVLQGGWFALLATGVDNLTIDNLKIDTNRDGLDIDCCKNVRVSNCTVNSPWDDGICPKSSFALGYARPTENLTISNCYVTGDYQPGTVLDGTWKRFGPEFRARATGRIKFGTESNGGFKNITIANCVFESCRGLALETVDGAQCEDITITNIAMRDLRNSPFFLRLGTRMRGPQDAQPGTLKRILISNVVSYGAARLPSILSGVPNHLIEDVKLSDIYLHQIGGATPEMAAIQPPEKENAYPEPEMFGPLPAAGFYLRHIRNLELSNIEIATQNPDPRPAFHLADVHASDFFRIKVPQTQSPIFRFQNISNFRVSGSRQLPDTTIDNAASRDL